MTGLTTSQVLPRKRVDELRRLVLCAQQLLYRIEAVSEGVVRAGRSSLGVNLVDRVSLSVEVEVEADVEEVLVDHAVHALGYELAVHRRLALAIAAVAMIPVALISDSMVPSW